VLYNDDGGLGGFNEDLTGSRALSAEAGLPA
jgi:hypothetical protein